MIQNPFLIILPYNIEKINPNKKREIKKGENRNNNNYSKKCKFYRRTSKINKIN
jgi:hypothetical protein